MGGEQGTKDERLGSGVGVWARELAAALSCMAWNVAAYSALLAGERITRDFVLFLAFQTEAG